MNLDTPIQRRIAWSSLGAHLPILAFLMGAMYWVVGVRPWRTTIMAGAAVYLLWSRLSKAIVLRHHRAGLRLTRTGLFDEAEAAFLKSFDCLTRYSWVDRYRFFLLLDSSAVSYREMALVNAGYVQLRGGATDVFFTPD
jgi:hypothetical protein